MSAPAWVSYVAMVTGAAGTLMGFVAYRRTGKYKVLDLRLELRKAEAEARSEGTALAKLITDAKASRLAVFGAVGLGRSGGSQVWQAQCDEDEAALSCLMAFIPKEPCDYAGVSDSVLESRLVEAHRVLTECKLLREKYLGTMSDDDRQRSDIRAAHHNRH